MLELEAGASAKDASVTLGELDSACVHGKANVTKLLVERSKRSQSVTEKELAAKVEPQQSARLLSACRGDVKLRDRLEPYVRLLRTDPWGYPLVHPKGAFVVVLGADRRKTGTHYTPKSLTERIVEETLTPLVYDGPELGAPRAQWKLKTPEQLLDLKVCDPAMGSGAFLVQACRFLSARLVEAWSLEEAAGRVVDLTGQVHEPRTSVESMPPGVEARAENARRIVAERCLYGVDLNPLAVELAKLSLWLVTLSKGRPFGFLDHNLRSGDSLLGITQLEQLTKLSMTPDTQRQAKLFGTSVRKAVEAAMAIRMQLRDTPVRDIRDVEAMAHLNKDARSEIATVEQLADAFIATVFVADKPRALDSALAALAIDADLAVQGKTDALGAAQRRAARNLSVDAPGGHSRTPFHWPIEFPEAFGRAVHGFDAVLANPPFLDSEAMSRLDPKGRANLARHFTCTKGNWDLYIPFFERALQLAGERGRVSLISPNKWLAAPYGSALRTHTETRLACLLDFSVGRAFEGVGVAAICAVFDTAPRRSAVAVLRATERGGGTSVSREAIVGQKNWGFLLSPHIALLARISSGGTRLGEFVTASDPFTVSEAYQLIDDISEADSTEQPAFRFINTGTVDPYTSLWGERETRYLRRRFMKPVIERAKLEHRFPRRHAQACQPKLILSGMRGFEAFLDERGEFVAGKSSVIVLPRDGRLSLLTCVGLLNSRLIRFYLQEAYGALGVDGGISFSGDIVEALPLPRGFAGRISRVDAAVRSLITTISAGEDASNIIGQVDAAVLDAYGIDAKDRRIIMEGDLIC
ncbi:MAG: DNA methyltransferase [Polyangiaceae bacterium]